jgi:hypothetical protein
MPVRHSDFAFVEESFDPSEYPDEIRPIYGDDRFPFVVPKAKVDDSTLSKTALLFRERVAEITGARPEEVPVGLLRAVEAVDAWPDENVRNLASGRVRSISTENGAILYAEFWANPAALTGDPNNGRAAAELRDKGLPYLEAIRDDDVTGAPVIGVEDATEFITGVEESAASLGFMNNITDAKDLADANWVGLQGVHEPATVIPTLVEDAQAHRSWVMKLADGNRRVAIERRCLREATGLATSEIESWADHLHQPDGTVVLRDWTAKDVENVRRKAQFKDAKYWRPAAASQQAIEGWLAGSNIAQRTVVRTSVVLVRLVVGYRNLKEAGHGRSKAAETVDRLIRRTHIKSAAQKEWDPATQATDVALDSMRRMRARYAETFGYMTALSRDELDRVYANKVTDWQGTDVDDPLHPLRLAAKSIATFICTDTTAEGDVKASLTAHSMSTHHSKIRDNRAQVAASVAMPILGINVADKTEYTRARAAVDRTSRHPMFALVKKHPKGPADPWWRYLNRPVKELLDRADKEFDDGMGTGNGPDEKSAGTFGPATRALLFLATIGQATNPAFRNPLPGEQATPWQLTINGLGGTRGNTSTTPDLVMSQVLARHKKDGVRQLAEILRAALAGELPTNTLDPDYEEADSKGQPMVRTRGTVTERFLRSEVMGWTRAGGGGGGTPPPPAGDPYDRALSQLGDAVSTAAANTAPFTQDDKVGKRFREAGLPTEYTEALLPKARRVVKVLEQGEFIAEMRRGLDGLDFNGEDPS